MADRIIAGYVRRTSERESLLDQKGRIENYVLTRYDWQRAAGIEWYEEAFSVHNMRPQWLELWRQIEGMRVSHIVVCSLWRLGLSPRSLNTMFDALKDYDCQFCSVIEPIESGKPGGDYARTIIASLSHLQTERSRQKTQGRIAANLTKREQRRLKREHRELINDFMEMPQGGRYKVTDTMIRECRRMRHAGVPWKKVCKTLGIAESTGRSIMNGSLTYTVPDD